MKEQPILFRVPMVRALLAGTKTQTRRAVKHPERFEGGVQNCLWCCPYGQPGDRLWVRESTHRRPMLHLLTGEPLDPKYDGGAYSADDQDVLTPEGFDFAWWYSRESCPSIHMPRWASRLLLEITEVRVERLQDISEVDAWAEGCTPGELDDHGDPFPAEEPDPSGIGFRGWDNARDWYADLWESINGEDSWDANHWVWAVSFKKVTP